MTRSLESLFDRYRARGDVQALADVFDRTAAELLGVALHVVRDPVAAEDPLQETFLLPVAATVEIPPGGRTQLTLHANAGGASVCRWWAGHLRGRRSAIG